MLSILLRASLPVVALASLLLPTRQGYPIPGLGKEQVPRRRRSQRCRLVSQLFWQDEDDTDFALQNIRANGFRSICANASAECPRALYLKHRPIGLHLCDTGRRARGRFHRSPRRRLRRLRQMAQLKRATILRATNA